LLFGEEQALAEGIPLDFNLNKKLFKIVYEYNDLDYYFQYVRP